MPANPKVTVITITYNLLQAGRKAFFKQCIESVRQQTYDNIEHLIIDGASTDGTLDLIKEYAAKGWVRYYSERDGGVYDAMNKGIDKANGYYINFLNSDDYFNHPDGIKLSVQSLLETDAEFSFAGCVVIDQRGRILGRMNPVIESFLFRMPFSHQTMLTKKETILRLHKFDHHFQSAGDFDFVMRLCLSGARFVEVPIPFVSYRLGGISDRYRERSRNECARSCEKNLSVFVQYDIDVYKKMFMDLVLPKALYEELIDHLEPAYKTRLMDLINSHSIEQGDCYKILKYPALLSTRFSMMRRLVHFMRSMVNPAR